jgi:chromosome segregation ATPase
MIDKVKKIIKSVEEIEDCKKQLCLSRKEMEDCIKEIKEISKQMTQYKENQEKEDKKLIEIKKESISNINKISDEFQKELNDFKTMKTKLKTEIVEKVSLDIRKELDIYIMNIKQKIENLNEAAKEIVIIAKNTNATFELMTKLKQISTEIKKEDFELSKYSAELRRNDQEKLNLMRKIDSLEKLIASMRRRQR